jgi:hypothetical protein
MADIMPFPTRPVTPVVLVETDDGDHGWHVRARRRGEVIYCRSAYGWLPAAVAEADRLAVAHGWRRG